MRTTYEFNQGWKFHRGELDSTNHQAIHANRFKRAEWLKAGNHGVARLGYPDEAWRDINLPHDFVIEGEFQASANAVHGSLPTDVGWYRKTFEIPKEASKQRIHLEFDGIYRDATIWVNGHLAGRHLSGYTSFTLDITELCDANVPNVVAVRCDAREFELWSYEGGGIYRDVRLIATNCVYVPYCGTQVRCHFHDQQDLNKVELLLRAEVFNTYNHWSAVTVVFKIFSNEGDKPLLQMDHSLNVDAENKETAEVNLELNNPLLWSPSSPSIYRLETEVRFNNELTDQYTTHFGIRLIEFDADKGFKLNGEQLKLKGVCNHQDHAGVGVAVNSTIDSWRLQQLKAMGCNAIRTAHNPPSPHLLDLCDRMGFLVIDESRLPGTAPELLEQWRTLIVRDRNHPCVCLWSLGNEEMLIQEDATGPKLLNRMQNLAHRLDPTRPCIYSANCDFNKIAKNFEEHDLRVDVFGANYTMRHNASGKLTAEAQRYDEFKESFPDWPLLASESGGSASTRGLYGEEYFEQAPLRPHPEAIGADPPVYLNPKRAEKVTAYAETLTPWGRSIEHTWEDCATRDYIGGTFLWAGFDYRGETYPFSWPAVVTRYGIMDLCGFPKDSYYYYQAEWTNKPVLHLLPHWNLSEKVGTGVDVWAYTNCAKVELWLNGESQGKLCREKYKKLQWVVPFNPGVIEAVGYDDTSKEIIRTKLETTSKATKLQLTNAHCSQEIGGDTVAIITVTAEDAEGRFVPTAEMKVDFELQKDTELLGVGNGNPTSHESDKVPHRQLFNGYAQLLVRASKNAEKISVKARSVGLDSDSIDINILASATVIPSIEASLVSTQNANRLNPVDGSL
ncbi:MAG TPA: hypothetical protein DD622_00305 [Opitutae bacterium]|nr:hypothetical protein [Opitutae bacterium]